MGTSTPVSRTDWRTPRALFDPLQASVGFKVDAAANAENHLLPTWYGPGGLVEDALTLERWLTPAWCNPPYGKELVQWLHKFIEQSHLGGEIMALLPANVETRWWADLVVPHADLMFLTGRIPFEHPDRTTPSQPDHPSCLVYYSPRATNSVCWVDWKKTRNGEESKAA